MDPVRVNLAAVFFIFAALAFVMIQEKAITKHN